MKANTASRVAMIAVMISLAPTCAFSALIPFVSDGSLGAFNPTETAIFNTNTGTYSIGSNVFTGGILEQMGGSLPQTNFTSVPVMVFNFSTFDIVAGVNVYAFGSVPIVFAATSNITIAGTISVSGSNGAANPPTGSAGGGGGGGGGGLGLFTNASEVRIASTGRVLANGGDGSLGGSQGGPGTVGAAGGVAGAGGSSGGDGGTISGAGNGGGGSGGVALAGGGGGGGGGGTDLALGGVDGIGGFGGPGAGLFSTNGKPGNPGVGPAGGLGGTGGGGGFGGGAVGGTGGNYNGGAGNSGAGGAGLSWGASGGGGGADCSPAPCAPGNGGNGATGGVSLTITVTAGIKEGKKSATIEGSMQGKGGDAAPGGAGSVMTGSKNSSFINEGVVSVVGGTTNDPITGFSSQGSGGTVYIMDENVTLGNIVGSVFVDTVGEADPGNVLFVGGVGGGGGGAEGLPLPIPEPPTWVMLLIGFASLGFARYRVACRTA